MDVEKALFRILCGSAGVSALVGDRIYPGVLAQKVVYPAIAYRLVRREILPVMEDPGASTLVSSRLRIFSTAHGSDRYGQAKEIDRAVYAALQGYRGIVTDGLSPADEIEIQRAFLATTFDGYEDSTQTHQVISDFTIWSRPA